MTDERTDEFGDLELDPHAADEVTGGGIGRPTTNFAIGRGPALGGMAGGQGISAPGPAPQQDQQQLAMQQAAAEAAKAKADPGMQQALLGKLRGGGQFPGR